MSDEKLLELLENENKTQEEIKNEQLRKSNMHRSDRAKTQLEEMISRAKQQAIHDLESVPEEKPSTVDENSPQDIAKLAFRNRKKIKEAAVKRLETLEEMITEFNDGYQESKLNSMNEILSKENYFEQLKTNVMKKIGLEDDEIQNQTPTSNSPSEKK